MAESLPSYDESVGRPLVLDHVLSQSDSSSISSDAPPAFSLSPITLCLRPHSTLITPVYHEPIAARALYELNSQLNGHQRSIYIAEVPVITKLSKSGHLPKIEKRHHLYKIAESQEGAQRYVEIDGRKTRTIQGTILRRSAQGTAFVATNHGDKWGSRGQLIYCARARSGVIEWMDAQGSVVAIDNLPNDQDSPETLQILVSMDRKLLDMLVAVWIGRIHQGKRDELCESRRRFEESLVGSGKKRQQTFLTGSRSFMKTLTV